jgi:hypothetical protein
MPQPHVSIMSFVVLVKEPKLNTGSPVGLSQNIKYDRYIKARNK